MGPERKTLYTHLPHWHKIANPNDIHQTEQAGGGINTRIAVAITKAFGSIQAFYVLVAWMFIWMALASSGVWLFANDRYPFQFLLFLSNLVQLWALPVLAVGTAVLGRKQEIQADEDFKTNIKAEHEIVEMVSHLNAQDEQILEIAQRLDNQRAAILSLAETMAKQGKVTTKLPKVDQA